MLRSCSERVVANLPVHSVRSAKEIIRRQFFKREHAARVQQAVQIICQEHVEVEIESAESINRQVSKEIKTLDRIREGIKDIVILREMSFQKRRHIFILEEKIII